MFNMHNRVGSGKKRWIRVVKKGPFLGPTEQPQGYEVPGQ